MKTQKTRNQEIYELAKKLSATVERHQANRSEPLADVDVALAFTTASIITAGLQWTANVASDYFCKDPSRSE